MGKQSTRWFRSGPLDIEVLRSGVLLSGHEARHVQAGADDIDAALDSRAIALANQGEIVFRAAAANTLAALAVGVAGQSLLTGGPAADPSWGAPAPAAHAGTHEPTGIDEVNDIDIGDTGVLLSAHEARHVAGGADDIDSALDARAIALANQGEIVFRAAAANTLAALAPGVSGQFLKTQGVGADPVWADAGAAFDYQAFTGSGTWTKPSGVNMVYVEVISGGGGGGGAQGDAAGGIMYSGNGGGGGARICQLISAALCGATEVVTVGAGGGGGAGGSSAHGAAGGNGDSSSFGALVVAGGGAGGGASSAVSGGKGGSNRSIDVVAGAVGMGGVGAGSITSPNVAGKTAEYGGSGGAGQNTGQAAAGKPGGAAAFGGGGGGAGGAVIVNVEYAGGAGGASGATAGGAAGAVDGGAGGAGGAASGIDIGSGGGGGGGQDLGTGGVGGAGGAPGGGGGGGGGGTTVGGAGGAGARGEVRVWSW